MTDESLILRDNAPIKKSQCVNEQNIVTMEDLKDLTHPLIIYYDKDIKVFYCFDYREIDMLLDRETNPFTNKALDNEFLDKLMEIRNSEEYRDIMVELGGEIEMTIPQMKTEINEILERGMMGIEDPYVSVDQFIDGVDKYLDAAILPNLEEMVIDPKNIVRYLYSIKDREATRFGRTIPLVYAIVKYMSNHAIIINPEISMTEKEIPLRTNEEIKSQLIRVPIGNPLRHSVMGQAWTIRWDKYSSGFSQENMSRYFIDAVDRRRGDVLKVMRKEIGLKKMMKRAISESDNSDDANRRLKFIIKTFPNELVCGNKIFMKYAPEDDVKNCYLGNFAYVRESLSDRQILLYQRESPLGDSQDLYKFEDGPLWMKILAHVYKNAYSKNEMEGIASTYSELYNTDSTNHQKFVDVITSLDREQLLKITK